MKKIVTLMIMLSLLSGCATERKLEETKVGQSTLKVIGYALVAGFLMAAVVASKVDSFTSKKKVDEVVPEVNPQEEPAKDENK